MDDKIRAALLGDPDAAAGCTAAGVAINCPYCAGEAQPFRDNYDKYGVYCTECGAYIGVELECGTKLAESARLLCSALQLSVYVKAAEQADKQCAAQEQLSKPLSKLLQ